MLPTAGAGAGASCFTATGCFKTGKTDEDDCACTFGAPAFSAGDGCALLQPAGELPTETRGEASSAPRSSPSSTPPLVAAKGIDKEFDCEFEFALTKLELEREPTALLATTPSASQVSFFSSLARSSSSSDKSKDPTSSSSSHSAGAAANCSMRPKAASNPESRCAVGSGLALTAGLSENAGAGEAGTEFTGAGHALDDHDHEPL